MDEDVPAAAAFLRDLVNSYEPQEDDESWVSAHAVSGWFGDRGVPVGTFGDPDLRLLTEVREGLRSLLLENAGHEGDPAALARLDEALASVPLRLRIDGGLRWSPVEDRPAAHAIAAVVDAVERARVDGSWSRLKACARDTCQWAFYDASRNRSGRWCSMAGCGNYVKMRRRASRLVEG